MHLADGDRRSTRKLGKMQHPVEIWRAGGAKPGIFR
jgi:hypothetical protein